jgi:hypothetical protein
LFDVAELVGEVDGFVDGGVIGDAVEEEELVKAQAEKGAHAVLLGAAGGFAIDQPVEGGLLSDDTEDEFLAEAAVDGFQLGQVAGKDFVDESGAVLGTAEDVAGHFSAGNFSWFSLAHAFIVSLPTRGREDFEAL